MKSAPSSNSKPILTFRKISIDQELELKKHKQEPQLTYTISNHVDLELTRESIVNIPYSQHKQASKCKIFALKKCSSVYLVIIFQLLGRNIQEHLTGSDIAETTCSEHYLIQVRHVLYLFQNRDGKILQNCMYYIDLNAAH